MNNTDKKTAWYRQPLVWMLIAIPMSAVLGGISMIYLAVTTDDGLVKDDYYRYGKQINLVLERDIEAKRLGLEAKLIFNAETNTVLVTFAKTKNKLPDSISLVMQHATRTGYDKDTSLVRTAKGDYYGAITNLIPGKWYTQLSTPTWRLSTELKSPGQTTVSFLPK